MDENEWKLITEDYVERMRIAKIEGIENEKKELIDLFKRMETKDYDRMLKYGKLPEKIIKIIDF